jgi:hypothetical protein
VDDLSIQTVDIFNILVTQVVVSKVNIRNVTAKTATDKPTFSSGPQMNMINILNITNGELLF